MQPRTEPSSCDDDYYNKNSGGRPTPEAPKSNCGRLELRHFVLAAHGCRSLPSPGWPLNPWGCTANAGTVQSQRGRGAAEARFRLDLVKLDFGCRFGRQLELSRYDK